MPGLTSQERNSSQSILGLYMHGVYTDTSNSIWKHYHLISSLLKFGPCNTHSNCVLSTINFCWIIFTYYKFTGSRSNLKFQITKIINNSTWQLKFWYSWKCLQCKSLGGKSPDPVSDFLSCGNLWLLQVLTQWDSNRKQFLPRRQFLLAMWPRSRTVRAGTLPLRLNGLWGKSKDLLIMDLPWSQMPTISKHGKSHDLSLESSNLFFFF